MRANIKNIGRNQRALLIRMAEENLVIRVVKDHDEKATIELQDEDAGGNIYEDIPFALMKSLGNRRVFNCFGWMPALFVTIDTYSLKKEVIEKLNDRT